MSSGRVELFWCCFVYFCSYAIYSNTSDFPANNILLYMYCHIIISILKIKFYKCYCYNSNHTIYKLVKVAMEMMPLFESYVITGTLHYRCSGILHTNKQPHNHAIRMLLNISSNNMYNVLILWLQSTLRSAFESL